MRCANGVIPAARSALSSTATSITAMSVAASAVSALFYCDEGDEQAYLLSYDEIFAKVQELVDHGGHPATHAGRRASEFDYRMV